MGHCKTHAASRNRQGIFLRPYQKEGFDARQPDQRTRVFLGLRFTQRIELALNTVVYLCVQAQGQSLEVGVELTAVCDVLASRIQ